jgi:hypothetical protein
VVPAPVLDGRRVESLVQELRRYAPHYTPDLNLSDEESVAPALMRIFAHLAETVLVRLGRTPHKHFVAFLDRCGISLVPARPARAAVTFRLVSGFNEAVTVPAGTRVTAAGENDDIPFETTAELLAIPGVLTAAYGVDPFRDVIYAPPPGFLAQQIRTPTELVYEVQAFASAGTNRLQLDHVTELQLGSFIRICGGEKAVVHKISDGRIVTLETALRHDIDPNTTVTPIRDFEVFDGIDRQEHVLYLGAADLFTIKERAEITVIVKLFEAEAGAPSPLDIAWQFWTKREGDSPEDEEHWHDLELISDGTAGLSESGSIVLVKPDELEMKEREVDGRKGRWIRAALRTKLRVDGGALPQIDTIGIAVRSAPTDVPGIPADQGFHNVTPIDPQVAPDVGFLPFGPEPRQFDQFYIASKEAFSKREAKVTLAFSLAGTPAEPREEPPAPDLSWEYWNGRGWLSLPVTDGTRNLLASGNVEFTVPKTIQPTEVAGQENFWIRVRLVGGDYGRETFKIESDTVVSDKSSLRPPKVSVLSIVYEAPDTTPDVCLTFNNLDYVDQTAAGQIGGAHFPPFERLEQFRNRSVSIFFGFDTSFGTGPVRLLIEAAERDYDERNPPELDWRFRKDRRWKELEADDGSQALTRQGILTLVAPEELTRETRFGQSLFWIAGSLRTDRKTSGADYPLPLLRGIFLNAAWALQGETITEEIAGSSDGEPNQIFTLQHADILEQEDIRVRETLSAEEQEQIEREGGRDSVVVREDLGGTSWVRWRETVALFDAGPDDRCYLIDRASGRVQFGDGVHGRIPPAGVDNIRAFRYRTGGGAIGNVEAGEIEALATAVAGVESVFNPTRAGGGSDKATTEAMLTIGPRRISHRDRAVSAEDFEELAEEASAQVAKARCLAATNLTRLGIGKPDPCDRNQRHQARGTPGWVSLILVPESPDPRPCPSVELRRTVKEFLSRRVPSLLATGERIVIRPPDYVEVGVEAEIFVTSLEKAATAESKARKELERLLHPLRGGADGQGWEFGRGIWKSDVFSALERIDEIDRVENVRFHFSGDTDTERVVIGPNELLASGQHRLAIKKA